MSTSLTRLLADQEQETCLWVSPVPIRLLNAGSFIHLISESYIPSKLEPLNKYSLTKWLDE